MQDTLASSQNQSREKFKIARDLVLIFGLTYAVIWLIGFCVTRYVVTEDQVTNIPYQGQSAILFVVAFFLFFTPLLYLFNCALAKAWLKPQWGTLIMYMGLVFLFGCLIEIIVDTLFAKSIGRPAWVYQIWPVHNGYTSGATAIIWPMYGFYLYFFHEAMKRRQSRLIKYIPAKGVLMAIDAMALETLANIFSLVTMNIYYFYYFKSDLHHFTTIEIFIPYVMAGLLGMTVLHYLDRDKIPKKTIGSIAYFLGLIVVFVL